MSAKRTAPLHATLHVCMIWGPYLFFIAILYREWTDDGQLWVQYVSSTPATRLDVTNLQEQLDQKLQQRQARETGICPVREELYSQCFGKLSHVLIISRRTVASVSLSLLLLLHARLIPPFNSK